MNNVLPRIVIKFHDLVKVPYGADQVISNFFLEKKMISWAKMLQKYPGIHVTKLFTTLTSGAMDELVNKAKAANPKYKPPVFQTYFAIDYSHAADTEELLQEIWKDNRIEYAYEESGPTDPPALNPRNNLLFANQGYLNTAPGGIDALYAWNHGGDGTGNMMFIDIEQGWDFGHEDLPNNPAIPLLSGLSQDNFGHGTSVLGIILAQDNNIGCVGITPFVKAGVVSQFRPTLTKKTLVHNTADAITTAVQVLNPGDVLLIESQVQLIRSKRQSKYPSEAEYAIFHAVELGTNKGIIIIEPAGNGSNDLDTFNDSSKKKVLKRSKNAAGVENKDFKDSGAIMVAGASSNVPHKKDTGTNFGSRIDCYAWGENIQTTGDGGDGTSAKKYISDFDGTSGAAAIIAGAAISVQSMLVAAGKPKLNPYDMRKILSDPANGTASEKVADNIGVMPDLKFIKDHVL